MGVLDIDRRTFIRTAAGIAAVCAQPRIALAQPKYPLVVVIANGSPTKDMSLATLRRIFAGEGARDDHGNKFIPFNHPPRTAGRVSFDRAALGLDPEQVSKYWIDRKIRGQSGPPRTVESVAILRRVVAQLKGAIAYLDPDHVEEPIKALSIDSKRPDDSEYPLVFWA